MTLPQEPARRTVAQLLSAFGIEQELLLIERAKVRARRARTLRVVFVDPVSTLRALYPNSCTFSAAAGCAILRANGRVISMRCETPDRLPLLEKSLAQTALELVGIDLVHQNALRDQVICTFPPRKRARGALPFVSDILPRRLIEMVANTHHCKRDTIQMVLRQHEADASLVGYAIELPRKTIEPRAFFGTNRDAIRDALVHALAPQDQFVVPLHETPVPVSPPPPPTSI